MLVVLGVALVIPEYRLEAETTVGAIWGLLSGFLICAAAAAQQGLSTAICCHDHCLLPGLVWLSSVCCLWLPPLANLALSASDLGLLLILGVLCTAVAHTLFY